MSRKTLHSLAEIPLGEEVRIRALHGSPELSHRLRELGICEDAVLRCLSRVHGNLICEVSSARVGLNASIARDILVTRSVITRSVT
jgi:Fe2+ transport system protein FeoA